MLLLAHLSDLLPSYFVKVSYGQHNPGLRSHVKSLVLLGLGVIDFLSI